MRSALNCIQAEVIKQKGSLFLKMSVIVPILIATVFAFYLKNRRDMFNEQLVYVIFFEAVAMGTPLIIAIFCGMTANQEESAGGYKNLLGLHQNKILPLFSKVSYMLIWYAISLFLAISLYTALLKFLVGYSTINIISYGLNGVNFILCAFFQYFFYSVVCYSIGTGIASIFGLGGLVITALSFTALGDPIWFLLPWSWSHRISLFIYGNMNVTTIPSSYLTSSIFAKGTFGIAVVTILMILIFCYWLQKWQGKMRD